MLDRWRISFSREINGNQCFCLFQEKGFGLFALSSLQPGTLLLVERSFADVPIKSNEQLVDESSHQILFALTQKSEHRSGGEGSTAAGKYLRQTSLELLKKMEIRILIDPKQSLEKLSHLTPLRLHFQRQKSDDEDEYHVLPYRTFFELYERNVIGPGLWPKLSRFNHSCLPNCYFLLINQLCFVSVLKPIGIGEELTISYLPSVYNSYIERTLRLRDYYIDECQCSLCSYDRKIGQADMQQLCRQFEENEDDEDKRRYLFKNLIYRYGSSRPLGFIEQLNQLKRSVNIEIFVEQVKHGYLTHPFILNYLLSHLDKYEKLKSIFQMLDEEFAYFNWPIVDQRQRWTALIESLMQLLQNWREYVRFFFLVASLSNKEIKTISQQKLIAFITTCLNSSRSSNQGHGMNTIILPVTSWETQSKARRHLHF